MPTAGEEAYAIAQTAAGDGEIDWALMESEYKRLVAERHKKLSFAARASHRALEGWSTVKSEEDWKEVVRKADEDLETGRFLIDRLGAENKLDPELMAMLLVFRRRLIDEHDAKTAAELMLIDLAVLSFYHIIRINGWIGGLAFWIEHEFFGQDGPTAKLKQTHGYAVDGLRVEDHLQRFGEQLLPLLDRCDRMLIRNLQALRQLKQGPMPNVTIQRAGQVNVANEQVNTATNAMGGRRRRRPLEGG